MVDDRAPVALIIPGTDGHPGENWFPWLVQVLEGKGYEVHLPALPTDPHHSLENWFAAFDLQCEPPTAYDLCVTHSLGTSFALRLVESRRASLHALISVAGCIDRVGIERYDALNASFLVAPFQWELLRSRIPQRVVLFSEDDPFISIPHSKLLAQGLGVPAVSLGSVGHVNAAAGFRSLAALLPFLPDSQE